MSHTRKFIATTSPREIQDRIANAIMARDTVRVSLLGEDGANEVEFRIRITDHDQDYTISLVVGVVIGSDANDENEVDMITLYIPTKSDAQTTAQIETTVRE